MKKSKSNITISLLHETQNIFSEQGWDKDDESSTFFNKYCDMLEFFSDDQQRLILELTRKFLRIGLAEYVSYINKALSAIDSNIFVGCNKIYILPLMRYSDFGKSKSQIIIQQFFKWSQVRTHPVFVDTETKPIVIEERNKLPRNINDTPNMVLFVDDFIGSGETAASAINSWIAKYGISENKIKILSLIAQETGILKIESIGIEVYCSTKLNKGISDNYIGKDLEYRLTIMKGIEDLLKVMERFRFGYNHTEALVSIGRTPNCTFPVFWLVTRLDNGVVYNPPFPR